MRDLMESFPKAENFKEAAAVHFLPQFLGRQNFSDIAKFQRKILYEIKATKNVLVLGMDFQPIITLGLRAKKECELVPALGDKYKELSLVATDRGGFATVHSPGQLIIYPMMDLKTYHLGIKPFIDILFATTRELLRGYGIEAHFNEEKPGLYTDKGKISFVGIKVDQGVVRHGIAINVNNDLDLFKAIRSCGVFCQSHDRVANYTAEKNLDLEELFNGWINRFEINLNLASQG